MQCRSNTGFKPPDSDGYANRLIVRHAEVETTGILNSFDSDARIIHVLLRQQIRKGIHVSTKTAIPIRQFTNGMNN